jgi:hypothetical protein
MEKQPLGAEADRGQWFWITIFLTDQIGGSAIHPDRLHALLSDDISHGLNDNTLARIEQCAGGAICDAGVLPSATAKTDELADWRTAASGTVLLALPSILPETCKAQPWSQKYLSTDYGD